MASLEDRLLGEKTHYYCSSSEDEQEPEETNYDKKAASMPVMPEPDNFQGSSVNTGPKGVIKDWQRYRQLETERRNENERERIILARKLAVSCRSHLDDVKAEMEEEKKTDDEGIDELLLQQYIFKRMEEMMESTSSKGQHFGQVFTLHSGEQFLEVVDQEEKEVTVVIHLFEDVAPGCEAMNGCLTCLAKDYPEYKFCRLKASNVGVSKLFRGMALPALLAYKGGHMVGNFISLTKDLGEDFFATDVEAFLIEHGILLDKSLTPPGIKTIRDGGLETEIN